MATLKKRRGSWYARVLWYDNHGRKKEKQVPLRTKSKVTARERLGTVNKDELDIKDGLEISFPWMNEEGHTKISVFTLKNAAEQWMKHCIKNRMAKNTLMINRISLSRFSYLIKKKPRTSLSWHSDTE